MDVRMSAVGRVGDDKSVWVNIECVVEQSCVLPPDLFSLYTQLMMQELRSIAGVKIARKKKPSVI